VVVFPADTGSAQPLWFNAPSYASGYESWQQWHIKALVMMKGPLAQPLNVGPLTNVPSTYSKSLIGHTSLEIDQ
jgi:hypothetical protein